MHSFREKKYISLWIILYSFENKYSNTETDIKIKIDIAICIHRLYCIRLMDGWTWLRCEYAEMQIHHFLWHPIVVVENEANFI